MAGMDKDFLGEAWAADGVKVGYLPQEPQLDRTLNVMDNIVSGLGHIQQLLSDFQHINEQFLNPMDDDEMAVLLEKQAQIQEKIDYYGAWNVERDIEIAMDALRCPPAECMVDKLSGGEKRRVALCRLLLQKPDLLLLDEPTNHLDAYSVAWLEQFLQQYKSTVVLITHDRYFLDNVVSWILELDRGKGIPFEGNYSAWLEGKQKRLAAEEKGQQSQQKKMAQELEWIRQSPKARQAKNKARINAYEQLLQQEARATITDGTMYIPSGPRLGDNVINMQSVSKSFGQKILFENISFCLPKGGIVGIIGENGVGKSTLFRLMTGMEHPDSGSVMVGDSVKMAYVDQSRDCLDNSKTIFEEISQGNDITYLGKHSIPSRAYCSLFNFRGPDQQKKVGMLSGGERNRLHLAKIVQSGGNVLFLDEPTNDLDIETLRSLEEALLNFPGCAVVISHDRFFLDRISTHILAFEGPSQVVWFEGNYKDYEQDYKRRNGVETNQPIRVRFKPLTR
jgi:ATP-binding cassette ChvD family protein